MSNRNGSTSVVSRPARVSLGGEPCLAPLRPSNNPSSSQCQKRLLTDARNGDLAQMKKRMRNSIFKKAEDVNQRDERHCTPLHYAAKNGHNQMIE